MHCQICRRPEEEVKLYEGILETKISKICEECAENEGIPLLKKPTKEQLETADQRHSVRERLEKMSTKKNAKPSDISRDQLTAHKNLNKLRLLPKKQLNEKLYDDYYWRLTLARRRRKMSVPQLAQATGVSKEIIESIEKGILPANFEQPITKLESHLNINMLRTHETRIKFTQPNDYEQRKILQQVGEKIGVKPKYSKPEDEYIEEIDIREKEGSEEQGSQRTKSDKLTKLSQGELDLSKRQNLQDISLSDLQNMKKEKEKKQQEVKLKKQHEEMFGEDIEFEDLEKV